MTENALLQEPNLVAPLGQDSQRVLQKGDDNQETTNCRQMRFQRLRVNLNVVLDLFANGAKLLDRVVGIGSSVSGRRTRVGQAVWVRAEIGLRASDVDSRRHGGRLVRAKVGALTWKCRDVASADVSTTTMMLLYSARYSCSFHVSENLAQRQCATPYSESKENKNYSKESA